MEQSVILIGMMGSGKTTCGELLARRHGMEFLDMDRFIETRSGSTIPEIFAQRGEAYFRDLEHTLLAEAAARRGLILATGGGAVLREDNRSLLRALGLVFWLNRPADQIFDREDLGDRPLAQQGREAFLQAFAQREPLYRACAHREIRTFDSPEHTVREIEAAAAALGCPLERVKKK